MSDIDLSPSEIEALIRAATEVRKNAHAPYSRYAVGAALLGQSGTIYPGCNVENASYGLSLCAERAAIVRACSEGERSFRAIAIVTEGKEPGLPCGACLQVLVEFAEDLPIIIAKPEGTYQLYSLHELLPNPFQI